MSHWINARSKPFWIILGLLIIAGTALFFVFGNDSKPGDIPASPSSGEITTQGTLACLPHKNTSGPQTLECAYGLKTGSGDYFALDTVAFPSPIISELPTGTIITVSGSVTPLTEIKDDQLKIYDIQGIIKVTDVQKQ